MRRCRRRGSGCLGCEVRIGGWQCRFFFTIISGVLVFSITNALLKFVFEPLQNFNKERGDFSFLLLYFGLPDVDRAKKIQEEDYNIGLLTPSLLACAAQIPFYDYLASISFINLPHRRNLQEAVAMTALVAEDIRKESKKERDRSIDGKLVVIAGLLKVPAPPSFAALGNK